MIRVFYLCDHEYNTKCRATHCAHKRFSDGFCKHTLDRKCSLNYKRGEPTDIDLKRHFEVVEDGEGFSWWEVERKT